MANFKNLKLAIVFKKIFLTLALVVSVINSLRAQQAYPITDSQPLLVNGLEIGYQIKSQEIKNVGDKGDFSRYAIKFYVTNTLNEPKIILYQQGWDAAGNAGNQLARFNCINATGARFTSTSATLNASPSIVQALVDDRECGTNKTVQTKRVVQIGYWIRPGETISADEIIIVPLNELPKIEAYYAGNAQFAPPPVVAQPNIGQNGGPALVNMQAILKIKNIFNNTYINAQLDWPASTTIKNDWLSARWQLAPVPGTNFVTIKNRWKGTFLNIDRDGRINLTPNFNAPTSAWVFEPTNDLNIFRIKNTRTGDYLCIVNNNLSLSRNQYDLSFGWLLEQP